MMLPVTLQSFEDEQNYHEGEIPQQDQNPKWTEAFKKSSKVVSDGITAFGSGSGLFMWLLRVGMEHLWGAIRTA